MDLDQILGNDAVIGKTWKTTPDGGDPKVDAVTINGKINFAGLTIKEVLKIATRPLVITRQGIERKMDDIPTSCTINAKSPGTKSIDDLSDKEALEMLAKLQAKLAKK